jgi:hypothetical protein
MFNFLIKRWLAKEEEIFTNLLDTLQDYVKIILAEWECRYDEKISKTKLRDENEHVGMSSVSANTEKLSLIRLQRVHLSTEYTGNVYT